MKCHKVLVLACLLGGFAARGIDASPSKSPVVMEIDGRAITQEQVDLQVNLLKFQLTSRGRTVDDSIIPFLKKQAADTLIQMELLCQSAEKAGLAVNDADTKAEMEKTEKQFGSKENFDKALSAAGVSRDYFSEQVHRSLLADRYIAQTFKDIQPMSDQAARAYYDANPSQFNRPAQVRASHILFKIAEDASDAEVARVKARAGKALKRAKAGEDFAALAKELSEGPTGPNGGDLGFFGRGRMVKPFEEAAFGMKKGEISDLVRTRFGFHIIRMTDKREAEKMSFDEIKERLKQFLHQKDLKEKIQALLQKKRSESEIKYLDESLKPNTAHHP